MLQELSIQNFAIISNLDVSFKEGMTVLTGETGAGKSIIIDAVGLLVGGRGSSDYIRQGAQKCTLQGQFSVTLNPNLSQLLTELAIELDDNVLIVSREIHRSGKNACRINGTLINTGKLREIGTYLVDIHGQNEHQELMHADSHLNLVDQFGGEELKRLLVNYQLAYNQYRQTLQQIKAKRTNEKAFVQRLDMLKFQCDEIASGELIIGEEVTLIEERNRLSNFQKIADALSNSYEAIVGGEDSSLDRVGMGMNELIEIEDIDTEYSDISEVLKNSYYQLQEVSSTISRSLDALEMDEGRLDEVETRLAVIRQLKRKYGETEEIILSYYEEISEELAAADQLENRSEHLEQLLGEQKTILDIESQKLTSKRKQISKKLEQAILGQLKELYMDKTEFEVRFAESGSDNYSETGVDQLEFYITTNPGEPLKPLVKVVSGGELSRVMLALKTIFSQSQGITSIVFDEVDTGVSGRVAQAIANKIHQVAENSQVLCITHLPQVAAVADIQYFIEKTVTNQRTETSLRQLDAEERVLEVARMLSGDAITTLTKEHARELLQLAKK
ncbi:DNA repair protein RecN [Vagococcus salmoninarum]|uniref:DNA repair protein RecN n=1 Tax=Vagococcus salmoninarum TaxID=2739 RepID=UPI003F9CD79C